MVKLTEKQNIRVVYELYIYDMHFLDSIIRAK